jgi:hypothetical protein
MSNLNARREVGSAAIAAAASIIALIAVVLGPVAAQAENATPPAASPIAGGAETCGAILNLGAPAAACVRFLHVSPDAGPIDIRVDGNLVVKNLNYGAVTRFALLAAGQHAVQIVPAGQAPDAALLGQSFTFSAGEADQFALLGFRSQGTGGENLRLHQDRIDLAPLPAGQARIRLVQAVPGGGEASVTAGSGATLIGPTAFDRASDYVEINAGALDLTFTLAAANGQAPSPLAAKGTQFRPGTVYDLFVIGRPSGAIQVLVLTAPAATLEGTPAAVASPAAPDESGLPMGTPTPAG